MGGRWKRSGLHPRRPARPLGIVARARGLFGGATDSLEAAHSDPGHGAEHDAQPEGVHGVMKAQEEGPQAGQGYDDERGLEDHHASHVCPLRRGLRVVFDARDRRPTGWGEKDVRLGRKAWDVVAFLATEASNARRDGEHGRGRR
jgi:hypothetical protein